MRRRTVKIIMDLGLRMNSDTLHLDNDDKKNVILISIDALRTDHVGCYGYEKNITPTIDKLAERGVRFSQAVSNGAGTVLSFPAIFASVYPIVPFIRFHKHGLIRRSDQVL